MKGTKVQKWKMVVANLLAVLMVVMSVTVITPTAAYATSKPTLTKTTLKITEGKKYGLKIKNKIAKSSYKWSTSNKKVAKVNKSGVVVAVKKGKATITCKVIAAKKAYTLKCNITVVKSTKKPAKKVVDNKGNDGSVTNQSQLDAALAGSASTITIKTTDAVNLTIKAGDYSSKSLVVDAPNADVTNNGKFASIEIKQIKSSTWFENAVGNLLKVLASSSRIVVSDKASASIEVTQDGATLTIVNNGEVKKVTVSKKAEVAISGESKTAVPVVVDVPGVKITTSVPLNLQCNEKAELVINKGAEATKIQAATESAVPTIVGTGTFTVSVGTGDTAKEVTVKATPASTDTTNTTTTTAGGSIGGSTGDNTDKTSLIFDAALSKITAVSVNYGDNKTYTLSKTLLSTVKAALISDMAADVWTAMPSKTLTCDGKQVVISGNAGSKTKTVTVSGNTYTVTAMSNSSFKITNAKDVSVILSKLSGDKMFSLETSNSTMQNVENSSTVAKAVNAINSISATYNDKSYTVECPELVKLQKYINTQSLLYTVWPTIKDSTVDGMTITGNEGSYTKTVTVSGKVFTVTMNSENSATITNSSNVSAVVQKGVNNISVTLN